MREKRKGGGERKRGGFYVAEEKGKTEKEKKGFCKGAKIK